jgi:hypothetical protein
MDTELGPLDVQKAIELAENGEVSLVPIRRGITDIRLNCLLFDVLTDRGFKLDFTTGTYAEATIRNSRAKGSKRQAS